jgi:nucleoside-diphosphate-sugar epimerase
MSTHSDDYAIIKANTYDVVDTIEKVKDLSFKSFIYMSTSSVKLKTQTMYSRSKAAAELILLSYIEKYKLPISVVRPFSITGVGEQKEHLIPTLLRAAKSGEPVPFVPSPAHDFIDIDDIVSGLNTLAAFHARGIFELGSGVSHTNKEVLDIVEDITGKKVHVTYVPSLRAYDSDRWVSTNFRVRGFGWAPKKSLQQSIAEQWEALK